MPLVFWMLSCRSRHDQHIKQRNCENEDYQTLKDLVSHYLWMPFGMLHSCSTDFGSNADKYRPVDIRESLSAPKTLLFF